MATFENSGSDQEPDEGALAIESMLSPKVARDKTSDVFRVMRSNEHTEKKKVGDQVKMGADEKSASSVYIMRAGTPFVARKPGAPESFVASKLASKLASKHAEASTARADTCTIIKNDVAIKDDKDKSIIEERLGGGAFTSSMFTITIDTNLDPETITHTLDFPRAPFLPKLSSAVTTALRSLSADKGGNSWKKVQMSKIPFKGKTFEVPDYPRESYPRTPAPKADGDDAPDKDAPAGLSLKGAPMGTLEGTPTRETPRETRFGAPQKAVNTTIAFLEERMADPVDGTLFERMLVDFQATRNMPEIRKMVWDIGREKTRDMSITELETYKNDVIMPKSTEKAEAVGYAIKILRGITAKLFSGLPEDYVLKRKREPEPVTEDGEEFDM